MVKDKGLRCQYIVASEPKVWYMNNLEISWITFVSLIQIICLSLQGTPVSERAVPVAIFQTDAGNFLIF
jgi:DNA polymerase epsilon subunit 1